MDSKFKYLLKNMGFLTISNFSSKILVFFLVPLYTSVLTTEAYGHYDLVYVTIQLLFPILSLNLSDAVLRFLMDKSKEKNEVATNGLLFVLGSSILVAIGLELLSALNVYDFIGEYKLLILLYYSVYALNQFYIQFAKGLEKVKTMSIAGVLGTFTMVGFNLLFLLVLRLGLRGFFYANIAGLFFPVLYYTYKLNAFRYICFKINKTLLVEMTRYACPLMLTALGWWVNNSADKYIVSLICGVGANGLFSVAYKLPNILNNVSQIFIQSWQVSAIKEVDNGDKTAFYSKVFDYQSCIFGFFTIFIITFAQLIGKIMFAKDFFQAWEYAPFLLIAMFCNACSGFLGGILIADKNADSLIHSSIYGAVVNVVLAVVLALPMGVQGVCIATAASSLVIYLVRLKYINAVEKKRNKRFLATVCLLSVQSIIVIYCSSLPILSVPIPAIYCLIYRDIIGETVSKVSGYLQKNNLR